MRIILCILLFISLPAMAGKIYLAPTTASPAGNDANPGTLGSPKWTLVAAWATASAGDTIYMRGGTYGYNTMQYLQLLNGTSGNHVRLWAYPGETPIITRGAGYAVVNGVDQDLIYCEGDYLHWKGLEIANFSQQSGETPYPAVRFGYTNNSIFENLSYHDNMAAFSIRGASSNNLIINSDFYRNQDPYGSDGLGTDAYDGADGVQMNFVTGTNNIIRNCRAWWNADDGFDLWENTGKVYLDSCWAFWNGYIPGTFSIAGNGSGIKIGQTSGTTITDTLRWVRNCIAWKNRSFGIVENALLARSVIFNNTVGRSGTYGFWFGAWNASVSYLRNNVSYDDAAIDIAGGAVETTNSWQNAIVVSTGDFQSMDSMQLVGARGVNGELPTLTFLVPASGSDLINAGVDYGYGDDIGALQYIAPSGFGSSTLKLKRKKIKRQI